MFVVTVTDPYGGYYSHLFDKPQITIGRTPNNDLVLNDDNVSSRHAIISMRDGKFIIADSNSTNGLYVNGRMVKAPIVVTGVNRIHLAVYVLSVSEIKS